MNPDHTPAASPGNESLRSARTLTAVIYGLQVAAFFLGITAVIALIINYVKRGDVRGTWLESHFRWQIRTFWFSLLWMIVGAATVFVLVGYAIIAANTIWVLYRIIKGWLRLNDSKPMYQG
ncbi:hypothetical protein [Castellaniella sp. GW247-6E4]|uniref:DUF4870 family protein n=1 Tax=Castellaniella sp. GW247-6E4 TaxID=3140380 RepID=UPI00331555C4